MKKVILSLFAAFMLASAFPAQIKAGTDPVPVTATTATVNEVQEVQAMVNRLNEIKSMNLKGLAAADKKQLRKEVKAIKSHMKALSGGIYLSAGAIIIILLILLLL